MRGVFVSDSEARLRRFEHWHAATATGRITHIAIEESLDGKHVEWMIRVTDEQYGT